MMVLLMLVAHGSDGYSAADIDLEECDIARVAKRDQKRSPAGVFCSSALLHEKGE